MTMTVGLYLLINSVNQTAVQGADVKQTRCMFAQNSLTTVQTSPSPHPPAYHVPSSVKYGSC